MLKLKILFLTILFWPALLAAQEPASAPAEEGQERDSVYLLLVRQGLDALAIDSMQQAEDNFRVAMQRYPMHASNYLLYKYIAKIKERQNRPLEALDNYTLGLNLKPQDKELRLDRAALLYRLGNEARALSDYNDVLDIQPENMEALQMRAHIYSGMRDVKKARADYETILRLEPLNEKAYIGLILLNDRNGRPREAMEQMDALIAVYPDHAVLYAIRGGMEQERKQYEAALADLSRAIEMEPTNADFYVSRATLYLDMRKRKQAMLDSRMAVKLGADPKEMASLMKK